MVDVRVILEWVYAKGAVDEVENIDLPVHA
jgi:hypothetical protein